VAHQPNPTVLIKTVLFCAKATCFGFIASHPEATCKKYADEYQKVEISVLLHLVVKTQRSQHLL